MIAKSFNPELGYELIAALPYAYSLHKQGRLTGTISAVGSEAFYYFSPDHQIDPTPRNFAHTAAAAKHIPNMWIHKPRHDWSQWEPPPYKEHYGKRAIKFEKPTACICNRVTVEWGRPPINYFDLPTLRSLFSMLTPDHSVVYINLRGRKELEDNSESLPFGDFDMIREEYPDVRILHDIVEECGDYNETQLRVFAGCERFVVMNGGLGILSSFFGGESIIYTRECKELWPSINSFYNFYHRFGNAHIRVVNTHADLLAMVRAAWVDKEPLINILVRCHQRPKGLERLWQSITSQGYRNFRVIASYDDEKTWQYVLKYPFTKIERKPEPMPARPNDNEAYKRYLSPNSYFNELYSLVQDGYVMFMDDDDILEQGALERIATQSEEDKVLLWRVAERTGRLIPCDENIGRIVAGDISGIGACFHSKYIPLAQWEPWRRGDYRVIRSLASALDTKWLPDVLTRMGSREDGHKNAPEQVREETARKIDAINAASKERLGESEKAGAPQPRPRSVHRSNYPRIPASIRMTANRRSPL